MAGKRSRYLEIWKTSVVALATAVGLLAFIWPTSALADGGGSIASAPTATIGVAQSGNTATAPEDQSGCRRSFWMVPVTAGDELFVDWESVAKDIDLQLMPVGTTDFTVLDTEYAAYDYRDSNNKSQLTYKVPLSGLMPMYFESCYSLNYAGPYAFTASLKHAVFTSLTPRANIRPTATLTGTATLMSGAPVPDGLVFTLTANWSGDGTAQFAATSVGGTLAFPVSLPPEVERQTARFEISRAADASLLATKSGTLEVHVARAAAPTPKPVSRHPKRCRRGFKKKHVGGRVRCVKKHHRHRHHR